MADQQGRVLVVLLDVQAVYLEERRKANEQRAQDVYVASDGRRVVEPGAFQVVLGGKQPGFKGAADANTTAAISGIVRLEGPTQPVN